LIWGGQHVTAHDARDGKLLWSAGNFNPRGVSFWPAVASPVIAGEIVAVACGRADRGDFRFHGIKLGGSGDVTKTHRVWDRDDIGTFVPTPAEFQGHLYVLGDRGEIERLDPKTGKAAWRDSFPRSGGGNFYASPLVANGILYAIREDGTVFVARVDPRFERLAEIQMGERVIGSPVPVSNRLLIRGEKHLYCIAGP
jgi:outer membrane protein assembly factor BamB